MIITSLFPAELEESKIGMCGKGLRASVSSVADLKRLTISQSVYKQLNEYIFALLV